MIKIPGDISSRDLNQWIGSGVSLLDGETPVLLYDIGENRILLKDAVNGDEYSVPWNDRGDRLACFWPKCGSLNVGQVAVYLQRKQQQQYRRTYNSRILSLYVPAKWEAMKAIGKDAVRLKAGNPCVVDAAFNVQYPDWDDAMADLRDGAFSRALNPYIILAKAGSEMSVFYRGRRAGTIRDGQLIPGGYDVAEGRMYKLLQGRVRV